MRVVRFAAQLYYDIEDNTKAAIKELADLSGLPMPEYKPRDPAAVAREESYVQITDRAASIYQQ